MLKLYRINYKKCRKIRYIDILNFRVINLLIQYANSSDLYNSKKLVNWFDKNDQKGKFKLWTMNLGDVTEALE